MLLGVVVTLETTGGVVSDATGGVSRNARRSPLSVPSPTIWPGVVDRIGAQQHPAAVGWQQTC